LDFLRVKAGEKLKSAVPVVLLNAETAAGVKAGGILTHALTAIEVECLPKDLPHAIEIDIAALEVGAHITVADIKAPKGVEILTHAEDQVAGIVAPRVAEETEAAAEATEEA
ncbi:MAG: 50S ribosomal protein L25, partial [Wohlfahrtiimonas sp.]